MQAVVLASILRQSRRPTARYPCGGRGMSGNHGNGSNPAEVQLLDNPP
jgi:hypothetical protein